LSQWVIQLNHLYIHEYLFGSHYCESKSVAEMIKFELPTNTLAWPQFCKGLFHNHSKSAKHWDNYRSHCIWKSYLVKKITSLQCASFHSAWISTRPLASIKALSPTIMSNMPTNSSTSRRTSTWTGLGKVAWVALTTITTRPFPPHWLLWLLLGVIDFKLCIVEGEVDTGVIPPLLGHSHNGPPWSSTFGKVPLDNATVRATPSNIPKWALCRLYKKSGSGEMRLIVWLWLNTIRNSKGAVGWDRCIISNMVEYPKRTQLGCPLSLY